MKTLVDKRLKELRDMGLSKPWLDVAEALGVDAFLAMWRELDRPSEGHGSPSPAIRG